MSDKQRLLHINFKEDALEDVLLKLCHNSKFIPVPANKIVEQSRGLVVLHGDNPYKEVLAKLKEMEATLGFDFNGDESIKIEDINMSEVSAFLNDVEAKGLGIITTKRKVKDVNNEYEKAIQHIKYMKDANFNFDELFQSRYLKVRFGRMPIENVVKLDYYDVQPFIFKKFGNDDHYAWCVYFTSLDQEGNADNIFSALLFERIRIPDFVHGNPDGAIKMMDDEIKANKLQMKRMDERLASLLADVLPKLHGIFKKVTLLNDAYNYRTYVVDLIGAYTIVGLCNENDAKAIEHDLEGLAQIDNLPPNSDARVGLKQKKESFFQKIFHKK